jgi:hypothetical protein
MPEYNSQDEDRFYAHLLTLLSVSAALVGVCLTTVGLVSIVKSLGKFETFIDDLLAIGALVFMTVTVLSFLGIRTGLRRVWRRFDLTLDILFCLGLSVMVAATLFLTWAML